MRATMVCPDRPPRWSVYSRRRRGMQEMFDGSPDVLAHRMYHVLRETKFL